MVNTNAIEVIGPAAGWPTVSVAARVVPSRPLCSIASASWSPPDSPPGVAVRFSPARECAPACSDESTAVADPSRPRRNPDPRTPSFQQQFQNQRRISAIVLLLPHITGPNLRRIADPHVVSCRGGHLYKPLAVARRLHPNQGMCGQPTVKLLR